MEVKVYEEDICNKQYIYLDWNVVKYIKNPRKKYLTLDIECRNIIEMSKRKYVYPFCEAHFMDLANNFKDEYRTLVYDDLIFFGQISDGYGLAQRAETNELRAIRYSPIEAFENVLKRGNRNIDLSSFMPEMQPMYIDLNQVDEDFLFYGKLDDTCGYVDKQKFDSIAKELVLSTYTDAKIYEKLRKTFVSDTSFSKTLNLNQVNDQYTNQIDERFYKLREVFKIIGDEEQLAKKWKEAVIDALSLNYEVNEKSLPELIAISYDLLDLHPDFYEPLKGKNRFDNIYRDGKNIWYASKAKYFVSEDKNTRKKAKFIYKVFEEKGKVCSIEEFVKRMAVVY